MTDDPLLIAALVACAAVLIILLLGINSFRKGGQEASKESNKFMRWRLAAQFVAILLILAFVYFRRQSGG
ncbi:twin transmembrane helix small protein [Gymnodinialimonas hymeniacidonis]|uniref:twin transmembrane helix small protein n=1 Tax=Gymnodinialimonas hymeniacidonis TaxID=3126508 RepID=UPI0034C63BEE